MGKKIFFIYIFTIGLLLRSKAQDCTVEAESLKGKYEGECKKGLADGKGKATGTDTYEGDFKAGVPDGIGKYTWKNGDWYEGQWRKGKKDGGGTMTFRLAGKDSMVNGFWKKDMYTGKYEKAYIIHYKTIHVTHLSCTKQNNTLDQLEITLDSETGNSPKGIGSGELESKPVITDLTVKEGTYDKKNENSSYGKKIVYTLTEVTFPFRAVLTMGNDSVDLEFLEAGRWNIEIRLAY